MTDLFEIRNLLRDHFRNYFTQQKRPELKVFMQHEINKEDAKALEHVPAVHLIIRGSRITDITPNGQTKKLVFRIDMNAVIATRDQTPQSIGRVSSEDLGQYLHLVYMALLDFRHKDYTLNLQPDTDNRMMFSEKNNTTYCLVPFYTLTNFTHNTMKDKYL